MRRFALRYTTSGRSCDIASRLPGGLWALVDLQELEFQIYLSKHILKMEISTKIGATFALLSSLVATDALAAEPIVLDHIDRGAFYSPTFAQMRRTTWKVTDSWSNSRFETDSYQIRNFGSGNYINPPVSIPVSRSYFTFNIRTLVSTVKSAKLKIYHPERTPWPNGDFVFGGSYDSPDESETVTFFSIDNTSAVVLDEPDETNSPISKLNEIFEDLGSGSVFGSLVATPATDGTTATVVLTQAAIDSLNTAIQSGQDRWSIAASLTSGNRTGQVSERVFRGTGTRIKASVGVPPTPPTQLVINEDSSTPAPALTGLGGMALLTGLSGLGLAYRRPKAREGL